MCVCMCRSQGGVCVGGDMGVARGGDMCGWVGGLLGVSRVKCRGEKKTGATPDGGGTCNGQGQGRNRVNRRTTSFTICTEVQPLEGLL